MSFSPDAVPAGPFDGKGTGGEGNLFTPPVPVEYNPAFPIEEFDFIITDECHRSIYNLWRQVAYGSSTCALCKLVKMDVCCGDPPKDAREVTAPDDTTRR